MTRSPFKVLWELSELIVTGSISAIPMCSMSAELKRTNGLAHGLSIGSRGYTTACEAAAFLSFAKFSSLGVTLGLSLCWVGICNWQLMEQVRAIGIFCRYVLPIMLPREHTIGSGVEEERLC